MSEMFHILYFSSPEFEFVLPINAKHKIKLPEECIIYLSDMYV